jgi:hypothetical protein
MGNSPTASFLVSYPNQRQQTFVRATPEWSADFSSHRADNLCRVHPRLPTMDASEKRHRPRAVERTDISQQFKWSCVLTWAISVLIYGSKTGNRWSDAPAIADWNRKQRDMAYRVHVRGIIYLPALSKPPKLTTSI